ncbi:MAG: 16S rRNA (guanine(527)-N(7))-methyltransferase RsmG [Candidatus Acidiferrales bacterium]
MHSKTTAQPSDVQIAQILKSYYSAAITAHFCDQVRVYIDLLLRWNRRISLTTVTDPSQILGFHFGESLFAIEKVPIRYGRLADVGSGAGFPAVPIRMALEGLHVTLIESNLKKAAFLSEAIRELKLANVVVDSRRMEDVIDRVSAFDFVSARAVVIDDSVLAWASSALNRDGKAVLWLGQKDSAKVSLSSRFRWRPEATIPGTERRVVLVGTNTLASESCST